MKTSILNQPNFIIRTDHISHKIDKWFWNTHQHLVGHFTSEYIVVQKKAFCSIAHIWWTLRFLKRQQVIFLTIYFLICSEPWWHTDVIICSGWFWMMRIREVFKGSVPSRLLYWLWPYENTGNLTPADNTWLFTTQIKFGVSLDVNDVVCCWKAAVLPKTRISLQIVAFDTVNSACLSFYESHPNCQTGSFLRCSRGCYRLSRCCLSFGHTIHV